MDKIIELNTVADYNDMLGVETLNPLVSVVDFSKVGSCLHQMMRFNFYTIFLKDVKCGEMLYGRNKYDYEEGTLVFLAPGQVAGIVNDGTYFQPKGWALTFHPDLLRTTSLGRSIGGYSFFSYDVHEALHLSEQERSTILECLSNIQEELRHDVDRHSRRLIVSNIELFLNYCVRFYDRQFVTREPMNKDLVTRFEALLRDYFGRVEQQLPSVQYFADKLNLSANYFGDLIKKDTGLTAQEHIQRYMMDVAKERVLDPLSSVSEVAYSLGFHYPQHFSRLFKQRVGCSPLEYRKSMFH